MANTPKYIKIVYFLLSFMLSSSSTGAAGLVTKLGHTMLRTNVAINKATKCAGCVVRVNTLERKKMRGFGGLIWDF